MKETGLDKLNMPHESKTQTVCAFLALGSNLGDRAGYLRMAVEKLPDIVAASRVYETEPVGGPLDQGPYLNAVVELHTQRSAHDLLHIAQQIERDAARVRTVRNGPRTLDIDILLYGDESIHTNDLEVPHPRMWERRFVVQPLRDLAPEFLPANWEERVIGQVWPTTLTLLPDSTDSAVADV